MIENRENKYEIDCRDEDQRKMSNTSDDMVAQRIELQDLDGIAMLGVGGFGRYIVISLCSRKDN